MSRSTLTAGFALVLAGSLFALTPKAADAAGRGGHGGGGGFHGAGHGGGGFHGAGHVGVAHYGGYSGGFNRGGFYGRGYANYGYRPYAGYGYGRYGYGRNYGGYGRSYYPFVGGYYPYYFGDSGYYNPYYTDSYDQNSYGGSVTPYFSGYDSYSDVTPPDTSAGLSTAPLVGGSAPLPAATAQPDNRALLTVSVPASAQVWIDFAPTTATGPVREYQSPPLKPGMHYEYTVHARWNDNGHEVDQTQRVGFTAGASVNVQFPVADAAKAPAGTQG